MLAHQTTRATRGAVHRISRQASVDVTERLLRPTVPVGDHGHQSVQPRRNGRVSCLLSENQCSARLGDSGSRVAEIMGCLGEDPAGDGADAEELGGIARSAGAKNRLVNGILERDQRVDQLWKRLHRVGPGKVAQLFLQQGVVVDAWHVQCEVACLLGCHGESLLVAGASSRRGRGRIMGSEKDRNRMTEGAFQRPGDRWCRLNLAECTGAKPPRVVLGERDRPTTGRL